MPLSRKDIERFEKAGYDRRQFMRLDHAGYARLRNRHKHCFFYSVQTRRCSVYSNRPEGCRSYPVLYDITKGITVDEICKAKDNVTKLEIAEMGLKVIRLINRIDREAENRTTAKRGF